MIAPVINQTLVREATMKASGADIHDLKNLIGAYGEVCKILEDRRLRKDLLRENPQLGKKALLRWAAGCRERYEEALYTFVAQKSARTGRVNLRSTTQPSPAPPAPRSSPIRHFAEHRLSAMYR